MLSLWLHRQDPTRNMNRFYRLYVSADLLGGWCVVREWGRHGAAGQVRRDLYASPEDAQAAGQRLARQKLRRGYRPALGTPLPAELLGAATG
ncbi:hypothetical protein CR162_17285 [Pseudoroseomonas rhizosphaerae]|uniref:WGR domain-containing protein n=1 Tax=Teichococcus rhizosphaerae TaxID=1335062 RepID=A0A2C7A6X5_9PROT|nr:WGR domain-containing protein [Pseudoroseomonas rhizosphaerae]PHK93739.1 hypothetical protein CR162_17285 [Pseudoroseomonas rhizosphaerae]